MQGRVTALEGAENPFAEIAEQLTRLYGQKDAAVETVLARLAAAGGEARRDSRAGWRGWLPLAEDDPRAAIEGLRRGSRR